MKYIHYGSSEFDINRFEKIKNAKLYFKPSGGLWGSRVDITTGWKEWCRSTKYKCNLKKHFIFSLKEDAKVLTINNNEQLKNLPKRKDILDGLDFEVLSKEYDAIEVFISEDRDLYFSLYGWDCDSIIVMNLDKII